MRASRHTRLQKLERQFGPSDVIPSEVIDAAPENIIDRIYEADMRIHGLTGAPDNMIDFEEIWHLLTEEERGAAQALMDAAAAGGW